MFKEKISSQEAHDDYRENIIREYLGDRETLEEKIKEVKRGGDYRVGTPGFVSAVIGPMASGMASDYFKICYSEIMKVYYEIYPRKRREARERKIEKKDLTALAVEAQLEEEKRTGVSPEEFSQM